MLAPPRNAEVRRALLAVARRAVTAHVTGTAQPGNEAAALKALNVSQTESDGVFVTLRDADGLRGCVGHMEPDEPLVPALIDAAIAACSRDPRFPPVRSGELSQIAIELSILGPLEPVTKLDEIEIGRHGLVVEEGRRRGLLLPQVAAQYQWTPETFVLHTCRKAGLPDDAWECGALLWKFEAEVFGEPEGVADLP